VESHRYFFVGVVDDKHKEFEEMFKKEYGKHAMLFKSDDAIKAGLFGNKTVKQELKYRFGEYLVIALENNFFYYLYPGKKKFWENPEWNCSGVHGGMHPDKIYVPAIIL
jgi:hypothetical protein